MQPAHISVLLQESIKFLDPVPGGVYVDATFGAGGYTSAILEKVDCTVCAIDKDPEVEKFFTTINKKHKSCSYFFNESFCNIKQLLGSVNLTEIDGIVFDLGVSSMQLDTAARGFSFMQDAYLDMRMGKDGMDAYYVINESDESQLADIIYYNGGEHAARRIARRIVEERKKEPVKTTLRLAEIVRSAIGHRAGKIDPATKTFQAIRIAVNNELEDLKNGLEAALDLLKVGGKIVVVSFHELEDRIVKNFFLSRSGKISGTSRYLPENNIDTGVVDLRIITKNTIKPSINEIKHNPRARSARLRVAEKVVAYV